MVVATDLETVMLVMDAVVVGGEDGAGTKVVSKPPPNTGIELTIMPSVTEGKELLFGSTVLVAIPCKTVCVTVTVLGAAHESEAISVSVESLCHGKFIVLNDCVGEANAQGSWTRASYCSVLAALVYCRMGLWDFAIHHGRYIH